MCFILFPHLFCCRMCRCSSDHRISFNNVDLRVAGDGSRLEAFVDEVYNQTEFREL